MKETRAVYSGTDDYLFISYAHKNGDRVLSVLNELEKRKIRFWYDAGIEAGSNWVRSVASHLKNANAVVLFLSRDFLFHSQNCARELNYAVSEKKEMLCVLLESVSLPEDIAMQLSTVKKIDGEGKTAIEIAEEIAESLGESFVGDGQKGYSRSQKTRKKVNGWRIAAAVFALLLIGFGVLVWALLSQKLPFAGIRTSTVPVQSGTETVEAEVTLFRDALSRDLVIRSLSGEALYLVGDYLVSDVRAVRTVKGEVYLGEDKVSPGQFGATDSFVGKEQICYLMYVMQNASDLSSLGQMTQLKYLDISHNPVSDLSFLSSLENLETLILLDLPPDADYSPLGNLASLKNLTVSLDAAEAVLAVVDGDRVNVIVRP